MALGLPVLLLVMFGIFEFGFMFQRYELVVNAAREGARISVVPGYTSGCATCDVETRVKNYLQTGGAPVSGSNPATSVINCAITPSSGTAFAASKVTVTYTHSLSLLQPIAAMFGSTRTSVTLRAVGTMRQEQPAGGTAGLAAC